MKNRITVTILALSVSLYGFAGLWINLGNETIDQPLFVSIAAATVIAFF